MMENKAEGSNISALSKAAFDADLQTEDHSHPTLKAVANTLLLQEQARQVFADAGYAAKAADRLSATGTDFQEELILCRILFLLTYNTTFKFDDLFDKHSLVESIQSHLVVHATRYSNLHKTDRSSDHRVDSTDQRALSETLKLIFNLSQYYPDRSDAFRTLLEPLFSILSHIPLQPHPLEPPVNYLINALLNSPLEPPGTHNPDVTDVLPSSPLFPVSAPNSHTERLVDILDRSIQIYSEEMLETTIIPLVTLLRRVNELAPSSTVKRMSEILLPSDTERDQPLGASDTLASRLLKLSTTPVAAQVREGISSLLFELSGKDPATFVRNVGYGYAAGFLTTHKLPIPEGSLQEDVGAKVTNVDGREINPITGQRRDMEPPDPGLDMTDEEKEQEAERLFVLFERLKATGVMNVSNPVELAARQGQLEEIEDEEDSGGE